MFAHAWDSLCFAWYSLFIGVAGRRSILCGAFFSSLPPLCDKCLSSLGCGGSMLVCQVFASHRRSRHLVAGCQ